jgi:hypothetical protein
MSCFDSLCVLYTTSSTLLHPRFTPLAKRNFTVPTRPVAQSAGSHGLDPNSIIYQSLHIPKTPITYIHRDLPSYTPVFSNPRTFLLLAAPPLVSTFLTLPPSTLLSNCLFPCFLTTTHNPSFIFSKPSFHSAKFFFTIQCSLSLLRITSRITTSFSPGNLSTNIFATVSVLPPATSHELCASHCTLVMEAMSLLVWRSMKWQQGPKLLKENVEVEKSKSVGSSSRVCSVKGTMSFGLRTGGLRIWMV